MSSPVSSSAWGREAQTRCLVHCLQVITCVHSRAANFKDTKVSAQCSTHPSPLLPELSGLLPICPAKLAEMEAGKAD